MISTLRLPPYLDFNNDHSPSLLFDDGVLMGRHSRPVKPHKPVYFAQMTKTAQKTTDTFR